MDWFLYDNDLRHERVNIRSEIWKRTLDKTNFISSVNENAVKPVYSGYALKRTLG